MNFDIVTGTSENGVSVEVATLTHEGHEFTARGATIDFDGGYVGCYAIDTVPHGYPVRGKLTDFAGNQIGSWVQTGAWDRWGKYECYRMRAIRARFDGDDREWFGRYGSDWGEFVNLRPRKASAK